VDQLARDVLDHRRLLGAAVRAVLLEEVINKVRDRLVPHPLDGVCVPAIAESPAHFPEVLDVPTVGVDVDHAVDPVVGEVSSNGLDVVSKGWRVGPHRAVKLPVVGADTDVDRRRAEIPRPLGRPPCQCLGDQVIGSLREMRAVLFGRSQWHER